MKIRVAPLSASIFRFAKTEDKTADNKAAKRKRKMVSTRKNGWKHGDSGEDGAGRERSTGRGKTKHDRYDKSSMDLATDSTRSDSPVDFLLKVILALVVYGVGSKVIAWICRLLKKQLTRFGTDEAAKSFLLSLVKIGMHAVLILTIAGQLGVDKTSVAALVGSAGVAISSGAAGRTV